MTRFFHFIGSVLSPQSSALLLILLGYLAIGAGYALRTADWQAPDEPAHVNYAAQIVEGGCCPVIEQGDWDSAYLERLKSARFQPDELGALKTVQYEDHQPPLYYLLIAPVYQLSGENLTALRLVGVLFGAGVVLCAYGVGRVLLPERPQIALGAAAFVAFLPQHAAMLGSVNNDALAELWIGLALLTTVWYVKGARAPLEAILSGVALLAVVPGLVYQCLLLPFSGYYVLLFVVILALTLFALNGVYTGQTERAALTTLGLLLGLIFITKTTGYFMAAVMLVAVGWRMWRGEAADGQTGRTRQASSLQRLMLFGFPAGTLAALWWGRNLMTYGMPDFLGLARHDLVVVGQLRTADLIAEIGAGDYARRLLETTFNSFFGQFGWMALPLPGWMYAAFGGLLLLALIGGLAGFWQRDAAPPLPRQRFAWLLLVLSGALTLAQFAYYNSEFVQFQGRYLFPALIPFGVWLALGLDNARRLIFRSESPAQGNLLLRYSGVGVLLLLIPLNLYLLWRVIPGLAP